MSTDFLGKLVFYEIILEDSFDPADSPFMRALGLDKEYGDYLRENWRDHFESDEIPFIEGMIRERLRAKRAQLAQLIETQMEVHAAQMSAKEGWEGVRRIDALYKQIPGLRNRIAASKTRDLEARKETEADWNELEKQGVPERERTKIIAEKQRISFDTVDKRIRRYGLRSASRLKKTRK